VPDPILSIKDLVVEFKTEDGIVHAVDGVSYDIFPGETVGIVGESGSGKSVSTLALLGLIPLPPGRIVSGTAMFKGKDLLRLKKKELRRVRGNDVAMIFQDPMTSLNPVLTVGAQLGEAIKTHFPDVKDEAVKQRVIEMLRLVGVPNAETRYGQYPHEFSGGMRQRVMIAMAITNSPSLLIADEPTTALDVTIQAQILDLMRDLKRRVGAAIVLITHDLGVVAEVAERVMVMYAGHKLEEAPVAKLFRAPRHPYTRGLLGAVPKLGASLSGKATRLAEIPGVVPSLNHRIQGCVFASRCPQATELCRELAPALERKAQDHFAACHYALKEPAA